MHGSNFVVKLSSWLAGNLFIPQAGSCVYTIGSSILVTPYSHYIFIDIRVFAVMHDSNVAVKLSLVS